MQCPKCGGHNETGARFCGVCGAPLAAPRAPVTTARPPAPIYCRRCGAANPADSKYCEGCGAGVTPLGVSAPASLAGNVPIAKTSKSSGAWWLLPLFLAWVGGLVAWIVVRESDRAKARRLLVFGIVMTGVWVFLSVVMIIVGWYLQM
jgi:hypothetical protein